LVRIRRHLAQTYDAAGQDALRILIELQRRVLAALAAPHLDTAIKAGWENHRVGGGFHRAFDNRGRGHLRPNRATGIRQGYDRYGQPVKMKFVA
jgi:hypothetical protein